MDLGQLNQKPTGHRTQAKFYRQQISDWFTLLPPSHDNCYSRVYNDDGGDYADLLHPVLVLKNHLRLIHGSLILDHVRTRFLATCLRE